MKKQKHQSESTKILPPEYSMADTAPGFETVSVQNLLAYMKRVQSHNMHKLH
jgi:hypothetical protein